jgi:hypothetical protein
MAAGIGEQWYGSTQIAEGVDGEKEHDAAGQDAENIDDFANPAEGHAEEKVEQE